jgi:hypothetical protein
MELFSYILFQFVHSSFSFIVTLLVSGIVSRCHFFIYICEYTIFHHIDPPTPIEQYLIGRKIHFSSQGNYMIHEKEACSCSSKINLKV